MITYSNTSLKDYNTFHIDCNCNELLMVENDNDVEELFRSGIFHRPFLIIGEGSNMLFTKDFEGSVILLATKGIEIINEDDEHVYVRAAAGENWSDFVRFTIDHELYGAENLIGIPGLVGSCPVQNIGAYGSEVKDIIYQVEGFYLPDGEPFVLYNEECEFAYRDSIFKKELKDRCLITEVVFKLNKEEVYNLTYKQLKEYIEQNGKSISLKLVADAVLNIRNSKLPDISKVGCAGSFFKNPVVSEAKFAELSSKFDQLVHYPAPNGVKLAAGQLIESCGWKDIRRGDVSVYPTQALVIVNWGDAKGSEVVAYYQDIIQSVQEKYGILIEPEVRIVG
ncbi:MAG: UDP-N-acetylmuramate dehydrogenase [Bacteroidales bacterium]|nr:UDP-N-acetylmuramate dehydrogenase [Bacteroidales bacterium]